MESLYKSWFQFGVVGALSTAILSSAALSPAKAQNNTETLTLSSETNAIEAVDVTTVYGVGSVYTILVVNPALTNSQESITYTSVSGDTPAIVAANLVTAINADTNLSSIGVTATQGTGPNFTITSASASATYYSGYLTPPNGANVAPARPPFVLSVEETLALSGPVNAGDVVSLTVYNASLSGGKETVSVTAVSGNQIGDIGTALETAINADKNLSALGISATAGIVIDSPTYSNDGSVTSYSVTTTGAETLNLGDFYGTNGLETISVGGTVTPGDVLSFYVENNNLNGGQEQVLYTAQNGDTQATIACGLANAVNADTNLLNISISAACGSNGVNLTSNSQEPTIYTIGGNAQIIQCKLVDPSAKNYPDNAVKVCIGPNEQQYANQLQSDGVTLLAEIDAIWKNPHVAGAVSELTSTHRASWYLYEQPSDFASSTLPFTGGPNPTCFVAGALLSSLPLLGGTNVCLNGNIFAAVFEQNGSLKANTSTLKHSLAHETGHVVDFEWGGATGTNPNLLSAQPGFQAAYTADTNAIKLLPACTFNYFVQLPPGQSGPPAPNFAGGFFSEQYDDNLHLICNDPQITNPQPNQMPPGQLNSPYVAPNSNVIQQAWMDNGFWPEVFTPQSNILPYKELFAEMFAAMTGYTDTANVPNQGGADPGLASSFACSSAWTGLAFADNLPVPAQNFLEYVIPVGAADKTSGFYSNVKYLGCDNTYTKPPPYKFDLPR